MKKAFLGAALWLLSSLALATTLVPVQLFNPTGSTSGQAPCSTGPTSPPGWCSVNAVTLNGFTFASPPTTGYGSTTPEPVAATSVSSTTGILSTGYDAGNANIRMTSANYGVIFRNDNTTAYFLQTASGSPNGNFNSFRPLAWTLATGAVLIDSTGVGTTFGGSITTSQTGGIVGTTTNNNANAGSVGEYVPATSSSAGITTATATNITSISLTAGDWDVTGNIYFLAGTGTTLTVEIASIGTTSATLAAPPLYTELYMAEPSGGAVTASVMTQRISVASTTTVYLVGYCQFSGGTTTTQGIIRARRVR